MITYIAYKKEYLMNNQTANASLLEELQEDEFCDTAFKYAITLLKSNVISYAIECEEFEDIDYSKISTNGINFDNDAELQRRIDIHVANGMTDDEAKAKVMCDTIRNALAHGGERIGLSIKPGLQIQLTDIFHNVTPLGITSDIKTINTLLSSSVFEPQNIKLKEQNKTLSKKTNN
jgi:hypothetical protein